MCKQEDVFEREPATAADPSIAFEAPTAPDNPFDAPDNPFNDVSTGVDVEFEPESTDITTAGPSDATEPRPAAADAPPVSISYEPAENARQLRSPGEVPSSRLEYEAETQPQRRSKSRVSFEQNGSAGPQMNDLQSRGSIEHNLPPLHTQVTSNLSRMPSEPQPSSARIEHGSTSPNPFQRYPHSSRH